MAARSESRTSRPDGPSEANPFRVFRDPALLLLGVLPFALLLVDPNWMYAGPRRDPWIYFGYFRDAKALISAFPHQYYSSRLSVILPGALFHALLPSGLAHVALHGLLHAAGTLAFFGAAALLLGRRAALLFSFALGMHPFFLTAVGVDYVDGFGLVYFLGALFFLSAASVAAPRPRAGAFAAAGACAGALVSANVLYAILLPLLLVPHVVAERTAGRRLGPGPLVPFGAGLLALVAALGTASGMLGGRFLYLASSLRVSRDLVSRPNPFRRPVADWIGEATHLVLPLLAVLAALLFLARSLGTRPGAPSLPALFARRAAQLPLLLLGAALAALQTRPTFALLQFFYYTSLLVPPAFLALAAQAAAPLEELSEKAFRRLVALSLLGLGLPLALVLTPPEARAVAAAVRLPALLVAAAAGVGVLLPAAGVRRVPALGALLASLSLSGLLARELGRVDGELDVLTADRASLYRQIDAAVAFVRGVEADAPVRFWLDQNEAWGDAYYALASARLVCHRLVSGDFPNVHSGIQCDGARLAPDQRIVVVTSPARASAFEEARRALEEIRLGVRLRERVEIPGPAPMALLVLDVLEAPDP